jgi:hypothetical protein
LTSNTRINIGKGGTTEEAEPLVLGGVLLEALGTLYDRLEALLDKLIAGPVGMGNLGNPVPTYPQLITDLTALKADVVADKSSYIDTPNSNIVSQIAFTER